MRPDLTTESPDAIRVALGNAFRRGGVPDLEMELLRRQHPTPQWTGINYPPHNAIDLLVIDAGVQDFIMRDSPGLRGMAAARGIEPEQFQKDFRNAYEKDGVIGAFNFVVGEPSTAMAADARSISDSLVQLNPEDQWRIERQAISMLTEEQRTTLFGRFGKVESLDKRPPAFKWHDYHVALFGNFSGNQLNDFSRQATNIESISLLRTRPEFANILFQGNLEGNINSLPGFERAHITGVRHFAGSIGAFGVELSDGRKVFVKSENVENTLFGARLAEAHGMVGHVSRASEQEPLEERMNNVTYDTGIHDAREGRDFTRTYGISQDIHDYAKQHRTVHMMLPDGRFGDYKVRSVALLDGEVLDNPAAMQGILANPDNPRHEAVAKFFELAATGPGRGQIFSAWSAYHETCKRALLVDRYARNTAVFVLDTESGPVLTFQPLDTDFVAGRIRQVEGNPDFRDFNMDFDNASVEFIKSMQDALRRDGNQISRSQIANEFLSSYDGATLPTPPQVSANASSVLKSHEGKPFGWSHPKEMFLPGSEIIVGGQKRTVIDEQGGVIMHAEYLAGLASQVDTQAFRYSSLGSLVNAFGTNFITDVKEVPGMFPPKPSFVPPGIK